MRFPFIQLLLSIILSAFSQGKVFRVNITNGEIEGRELTANYSIFGSQTGVVFLGIPHLEPPVGELRFRKPVVSTKKWKGVLETKDLKPACMSDPVETYKRPEGGPTSEDCLYINVFTNEYCLQHKNCSVMVAIHGGQMTKESPATYHSDVIINNFVGQGRNIVVVTIPYRLGVFGLPNWPGDLEGIAERNLILYDCVEGLEWAHREVANFGGVAKRTTLYGHSGGAFIGTILAFREKFDHLYQRRVAMSMPTLMHSELANSKFFAKTAELVGCEPNSTASIVFACLRNVTAEQLFSAQDDVFHKEQEYISDFVVDGKMLLDNPRRLLARGNYTRKPLVIGSVPYELMYSQYLVDGEGNVRMDELLEICQLFAFTGAYEKPYGFVEKCVERYSNNETAQFLMDDFVFQVPPAQLARHHAAEQPVYLYQHSYSVGPAYEDFDANAPSPVHSEDFVYYMGVHRSNIFTEKDMKIERILTESLSNFVNFGAPSLPEGYPEWEKMDPKLMNYFNIDFDENMTMSGMENGFYTGATEFWTEIAPKYGGNFTFAADYPAHMDVFTAHVFSEVRNSLGTSNWKSDKSLEMAKKDAVEVVEFLRRKKSEFDSATNDGKRGGSALFCFLLVAGFVKVYVELWW